MGDGDVHPALSKQFQLVASEHYNGGRTNIHHKQRVARPQLCQSSWLAMHYVSCPCDLLETLDRLSS